MTRPPESKALAPLEDAELERLALFPLPNVVLLPGSTLALHLFEPRYRALARHCLSVGPRVLAIVRLLPGFERDYHGRPPIAEIAGAGRIVAHHARPDGTYDLLLVGVDRVRLEEIADPGEPFRVARASRVVDPPDSTALAGAVADLAVFASTQPPPARPLPIPPPAIEGSATRRIDLLTDRYFPTGEGGVRTRVLEATEVTERVERLRDALADRVLSRPRPGGLPN